VSNGVEIKKPTIKRLHNATCHMPQMCLSMCLNKGFSSECYANCRSQIDTAYQKLNQPETINYKHFTFLPRHKMKLVEKNVKIILR